MPGSLAKLSLVVCVAGCSHGDLEGGPSADSEPSQASPVTVSLTRPSAENLPTDAPDAVNGLLRSIEDLREHPLPQDADEARKIRRRRNLRIVDMATNVVRICLHDTLRQRQFQRGIVELLEARYQLALNGSSADIEQLYADVQTLNDADPASEPAAEGIYYLAKFAHSMARVDKEDELGWFQNFARWSREFADRFPQQKTRAAALLFGAGRSCEVGAITMDPDEQSRRLMIEAKLCYSALVEDFEDTSQAQEAAAVLRRLELPGNRITQFAGPTLTGGFINSDMFVGQITVVYFWDTETEEFRAELLPLLQQADQLAPHRIRFVGVNLDEQDSIVTSFLEKHELPGEQIVFSKTGHTGWNSPLARFWGISRSASVWLIDRNGLVRAVDVSSRRLIAQMKQLFE